MNSSAYVGSAIPSRPTPAAAIYLRVSSKDGRQDEANQEPDCRRVCEARGWPVGAVYAERESGAKARPVWSDVLELARRGQLRAVVVWSIDRIGRSMWQVVADVRELGRLGCSVVSVREPWLDTGGPTRDLLLAIFGWVAEHERERLRERVRAGLDRARSEGKRLGRPPAGMPASAIEQARRIRGVTPGDELASWIFVSRTLAARGELEPARTTGKHRHPARPWPVHTIRRALRARLPAEGGA